MVGVEEEEGWGMSKVMVEKMVVSHREEILIQSHVCFLVALQ